MRVLLTGSGGFLGRNLMRILSASGHDVFATTRNPDFTGSNIYCLSDPLDVSAYSSIISENAITTVVNSLAAGVDPSDRNVSTLMQANAVFPPTLLMAAAAAGARHFVQVGSSAEYRSMPMDEAMGEDTPLANDRLYGASKAAGTLAVEAAAAVAGIDGVVLRLFNVFGYGERQHRLFPSLLACLERNEPVSLSSGLQVRDFLYVDDACRAIGRVIDIMQDGSLSTGCYNLASGQGLSVKDFALAVAEAIAADPALLRFGEIPVRPDDLPYVVADTRRLDSYIGSAAVTPLEKAIVDTSVAMKRGIAS